MPFGLIDSDDEEDYGFGQEGQASGRQAREGKDACLFVVDCREAMFRVPAEEGEGKGSGGDISEATATPAILDVLELIYRVYDLEILACSRDLLGVIFVGAGEAKPAFRESGHFKTVHHFLPLGRPDAESSHRIKALCRDGGVSWVGGSPDLGGSGKLPSTEVADWVWYTQKDEQPIPRQEISRSA